jgi:hypothetical protein
MFKILSTYSCWKNIYRMQHLEGSGMPILYRVIQEESALLWMVTEFWAFFNPCTRLRDPRLRLTVCIASITFASWLTHPSTDSPGSVSRHLGNKGKVGWLFWMPQASELMIIAWTGMNAYLAVSLSDLRRQDSGYYNCYGQQMPIALLFHYRLQFSGW